MECTGQGSNAIERNEGERIMSNVVTDDYIRGKFEIPLAVTAEDISEYLNISDFHSKLDPILNPLQVLEKAETRDYFLNQIFSCLTTLERTIVEKRFGFDHGDGKNFEEIGESLGFCDEYIRQLLKRSIVKLRKQRGQKLEPFLYK